MIRKNNQQRKRGRWLATEDKLLRRLVTEHSVNGNVNNWPAFEKHFNGNRNSKQIRERWFNHLNPSIKKRKFNDDEIKLIEKEFLENEFKWAKIAKKIPNASPLMIKNLYYNNLRKKNSANRITSSSCNVITNDRLFALATVSTIVSTHPDSLPKKSEKMSLSTILNP